MHNDFYIGSLNHTNTQRGNSEPAAPVQGSQQNREVVTDPSRRRLPLKTRLVVVCSCWRLVPHWVALLASSQRQIIESDLKRWIENVLAETQVSAWNFFVVMTQCPEFRNLFYLRLGRWSILLRLLCPPLSSLYLWTPSDKIGPGLFIQHGFATVISADRVGRNCWVNQQVTIGTDHRGAMPVLEDNVVITAGAKVIGGVTIGANSVVGANAVVVKNVPPDCTVVGVPARIVRRKGQRVMP